MHGQDAERCQEAGSCNGWQDGEYHRDFEYSTATPGCQSNVRMREILRDARMLNKGIFFSQHRSVTMLYKQLHQAGISGIYFPSYKTFQDLI